MIVFKNGNDIRGIYSEGYEMYNNDGNKEWGNFNSYYYNGRSCHTLI